MNWYWWTVAQNQGWYTNLADDARPLARFLSPPLIPDPAVDQAVAQAVAESQRSERQQVPWYFPTRDILSRWVAVHAARLAHNNQFGHPPIPFQLPPVWWGGLTEHGNWFDAPVLTYEFCDGMFPDNLMHLFDLPHPNQAEHMMVAADARALALYQHLP